MRHIRCQHWQEIINLGVIEWPCWLNSLIADYYISVEYKLDYCFNYFRLTFSIISSTSPAMQYGLDNLHVRNGGIEYQHGGRKTGHLDGFNLSKTPSKCSKFQILVEELIFLSSVFFSWRWHSARKALLSLYKALFALWLPLCAVKMPRKSLRRTT